MQRGAAAAIALATLLHSPAQLWAQEVPSLQAGTILTIEPDRLIAGTKYGQAVQSRLDAVAAALQAENRQIDADLETEEVALTARRGTVPAAEFRVLAEAFDAKVEGIRSTQEGKGRTLTQSREAERQKVLQAAVPILAELMAQKGAVAILDKSSVFLSFDRNDVTDEAIAKLDAALGDGSAAPDGPDAPGLAPVVPAPPPKPPPKPPAVSPP